MGHAQVIPEATFGRRQFDGTLQIGQARLGIGGVHRAAEMCFGQRRAYGRIILQIDLTPQANRRREVVLPKGAQAILFIGRWAFHPSRHWVFMLLF